MTALKIGVLTFHRCINYGSYWQAQCMVNGLRSRKHNAVILDHESRRVNMAEWKCAFQPVLPTRVPEADHKLYREKIEGFFRAFESMPLSPRFDLDNPAGMDHYDVVVVGSDEVWNLTHPWYGRCPLFYGDGVKTDRLVSYAASFGNYQSARGLEDQWADKLRNFHSISVRDENSQEIVRNALGFNPEMVLDPCLQFPVVPEPRSNNHIPEPYIAVYGHNFTAAFSRQIRSYADSRNLQLISIGYRNDWADQQWITADPHDFAHFIANSEAVATNFFHGCVFALRNHKPFVCETTPYRSNKLKGLMSKIGGERHMIYEGSSSESAGRLLSDPLSTDIIQKIQSLRQSSDAYLDRALELKQLQLA